MLVRTDKEWANEEVRLIGAGDVNQVLGSGSKTAPILGN